MKTITFLFFTWFWVTLFTSDSVYVNIKPKQPILGMVEVDSISILRTQFEFENQSFRQEMKDFKKRYYGNNYEEGK